MSSIDRLHKFAELLCRAIPDFDPSSLSPRPLDDPGAPMHVGRLQSTGNAAGSVRVLFGVAEASDFVPLAFTTCEDTEVAISLAAVQGFVDEGLAPPVGSSFGLSEARALNEMGIAGVVLLKPGMLEALSGFQDGMENGGEAFDPRLAVFIDAGDLATADGNFPALMQKFKASGRSVFLTRQDF